MNTLTNNLNTINPYAQSPAAITTTQSTTAVKPNTATSVEGTQDSQFSQQALQALQALIAATQGSSTTTSSSKDPLANLVANGTITQDQSNTIKSAFKAARQANATGTYSSSQSNPISSLVANGTITQAQATAIQGDLKSVHGHHHHGGGKKVDSATQIDPTALTTAANSTSATSPEDIFSNILANIESDSTGTQSQSSTGNPLETFSTK